MRFASLSIALGILAFGYISSPAVAATSSASFGVTVTVLSSCAASTPVAAFGNSATAAASPVSINCTNPTPYNVSLSADLAAPSVTIPANSLPGYRLSPAATQGSEHNRFAGSSSLARTSHGALDAATLLRENVRTQAIASGAFADAVTVTVVY